MLTQDNLRAQIALRAQKAPPQEQQQQPRAQIALREHTRLQAQVRAPIALRELTPLLAAAKRLHAMVEQHQSPVFALRELTPLLAAAQPLIARVEIHQSPVNALLTGTLLLAPAQRRRVQHVAPQSVVAHPLVALAETAKIAQLEEVQALPPAQRPVLLETVGRCKPAGSFFYLSWTRSSSTACNTGTVSSTTVYCGCTTTTNPKCGQGKGTGASTCTQCIA
jgi:hypothetical protein